MSDDWLTWDLVVWVWIVCGLVVGAHWVSKR